VSSGLAEARSSKRKRQRGEIKTFHHLVRRITPLSSLRKKKKGKHGPEVGVKGEFKGLEGRKLLENPGTALSNNAAPGGKRGN